MFDVLATPNGRNGLRQAIYGSPIRKAGAMAPVLATGSLPAGAVAATDLSGMAEAMGGGLAVTGSLGPGLPIGPAHPEEYRPRQYDYMPGVNVNTSPRQGELYSFETLFGLANNWDVFGIGIEKRKEEFVKLEASIKPRLVPGESQKQAKFRADALRDQISEATGFLDTPDQQVGYESWLSRYLDQLFKGDCATFYLRANMDGSLHSIEVPDGRLIKPFIDLWGNIAQVPPGTPRHVHDWTDINGVTIQLPTAGASAGMSCRVCGAAPAYGQVIKGMIWNWYGSDEIVYQPRWLRDGPYGHPPAEGIILSINRALRRQSIDLSWYTEGNLPAAFVRFPETWQTGQATEFLNALENIYAGNDAMRVKLVPIPGGPGSGIDRITPEPNNAIEEYLLHVGLAALGVSPMEIGFIRSSGGAGLGGKGVGEQQADAGRLRQISLSRHIIRVYNRILATYWSPDLVLHYPSLEERTDQLIEAQTLEIFWRMGAISTDDIAQDILQRDPPGLGNTVVTATGAVVPVKAISSGAVPEPEPPPARTPSVQPGVNSVPSIVNRHQPPASADAIAKALGGGKLQYKGDLGKVVYRYLLRSYDAKDVEWALDPAISWQYDPSVKLADIDMARRPGGRDAEKVQSVADSIDQGASMEPCVLVEFVTPDPAGLNVADGFHRTLGADHADEDAVPAFVGRNVPDAYHDVITATMPATSHGAQPPAEVKKATDPTVDLRRWRQKAIRELKKSGSASVSFESVAIPAPHAEAIAGGLALARSVDDVWELFGGSPLTVNVGAPIVNMAKQEMPAAAPVNVNFPADAIRIDVHLPEQPAPIVNVAPPAVTVTSPAVHVAPANVDVHLPDTTPRTIRKSVQRDERGLITSVTETEE